MARNTVPARVTPAEKKTLASSVADSLIAFILEEGLKDGDLLPSTADLSSRYGVSRTVVREAIADLAGRGILQRSQGRETIVVSPGQAELSGLLQFRVAQDGVSPEEVQETRSAIELITARLAAQRRTDEDVARLGEALQDLVSATRDTDFHNADVRFHALLAEASQNRLIVLIFEGIEGLVRETRIRATAGRRAMGESFEPILDAHRNVYKAVKAGRPKAAEEAMRVHLQQTADGLARLREREAAGKGKARK